MHARAPIALSVLASASLIAAAAVAQPPETGGRTFTATLTGEAEAPTDGDPDGSGTATVFINPGKKEICYTITVEDIVLTDLAAHIHEAPPEVAGPVVVPLTPPTGGSVETCTEVTSRQAAEILSKPGDYYVNVHNSDYPGGAVRGQLSVER